MNNNAPHSNGKDVASKTDEAKQAHLVHLLAKVALQHEPSFTELYQLTSGALFGFAYRVVNDESIASEVVQEAYIKIWNRADGYRPHLAKPMTWMITIARNQGIDTLRKQKIKVDDTPVDEMIDLIDLDSASPLESSIQQDEALQLKACLSTLSEDQQKSVLLSFYQGLSHEEISAKMDTPLGTIKSWVRRGLAKLKTCLEQYG